MKTIPRIATALAVTALVAACSASPPNPAASGVPANTIQLVGADTGPITPDLTPKAELPIATDEVHVAYAPDVPPAADRTSQALFEVSLEVVEGMCPLDPENAVSTEMWGYRVAGDDAVVCGSPGPVLRGRVGDVARITLANPATSAHPHNIDFHAVTGQGGGAAALTVAPGETATIEVRLLYPGAFMYHCAFGDVPVHIAHGMVGMFIVDPATPMAPVDHEWAVMQSEWYVGAPAGGVAPFDQAAILPEEPRYVTFNGRTDALTGDNALRMAVGERARFYMVNEGLSLDSNFHPIGSHWDTVWPEAATHPANDPIRGSQSTLVVAGGGTVTELVGYVPSTIILVDHALGRTFYKGALGQVVVEGDEDPEIFSAGVSDAGAAPTGDDEVTAGDNEVVITSGAYDPANAATAYSPGDLTVTVGTTVTWTNDDALFHTVTAGTVANNLGSPSGEFDSGEIQPGETFSFTFDEVGEFPYYCVPHPWMQGTVTVTA